MNKNKNKKIILLIVSIIFFTFCNVANAYKYERYFQEIKISTDGEPEIPEDFSVLSYEDKIIVLKRAINILKIKIESILKLNELKKTFFKESNEFYFSYKHNWDKKNNNNINSEFYSIVDVNSNNKKVISENNLKKLDIILNVKEFSSDGKIQRKSKKTGSAEEVFNELFKKFIFKDKDRVNIYNKIHDGSEIKLYISRSVW